MKQAAISYQRRT